MVQEFTDQNYLIIESNVVANIVVWNGDTTQWTPPQSSIALNQLTTPAMIWQLNSDATDYVLTESIGAGEIAFTWDGTVLTTNEPKPTVPTQPVTTGIQTA